MRGRVRHANRWRCNLRWDFATGPTTGRTPDTPTDGGHTSRLAPKPKHAVRGANGKFVRGDTSRRIYEQPFHGLKSRADAANELPPAFIYMRGELQAFVDGCMSDEGGPEAAISTRRKSLLDGPRRIHRRILQLDTAIEVHGLFTKQGKLRANWIAKLTQMVVVAASLDMKLGLDRKARDVSSLSPAEWAAATTTHAETGSNADAIIDRQATTKPNTQ